MEVAVVGTGYVGLTTAVSFALHGHRVTGVDVDAAKINRLKQKICPIYEPGLEEALARAIDSGALRFAASLKEGARDADVLFICVGTPEAADGSADLSYLFAAVDDIRALQADVPKQRTVVIKSTVPVGTADRVAALLAACGGIHVASNPEFLREGSALQDALSPSRIVIGADADEAFAVLKRLYEGVKAPRVFTTRADAELIKYASNAFLATKISFMNELARLCAVLGTDVQTVARGMGLDSRIGPEFLQAGLGFGGSCFPKDTIALLQLAKQHGVSLSILEKVRDLNATQPDWFIARLRDRLGTLHGKRIAVLGLAFKPNTDDIREAPSLKVLNVLLPEGAAVSAYDPVASPAVARLFPQVTYASDPYAALQAADAAVLVTEWKQCVDLDWQQVKAVMNAPVLFDGRNAWPADALSKAGFVYVGVGRS